MCGAPNSRITDWASASMAGVERASSLTFFFAARPLSLASSRSLAMTIAPSAMNSSEMARPMPWPAAVMTAVLSFRRLGMRWSPMKRVRAHPQTHDPRRGPLTPTLSPEGGEGEGRSVIVARHALLGDALIFDRRGEHHAVGELLDHAALNLLPGRLARREMEAALLRQGGAAGGELLGGGQDSGAARVEVDADAVAGLDEREAAAGGRLGRGVEDRGRARRAGLAAVADAGEGGDAAFDQRGGRLHVHHLGRARIANRPDAANDQDCALVDAEGRVLDAVVIVLRPLAHDGAAFERVRVLGIGQIARAELGRDHAHLHDGAVEQGAAEHAEAGVLDQRRRVAADHVAIAHRGGAHVLAHGPAVDRQRVLVDALGL